MSKSDAQRFAQKRNTGGGTLKGVVVNLQRNILPVATEKEKENISYALKLLNETLYDWSNNYMKAKEEKL